MGEYWEHAIKAHDHATEQLGREDVLNQEDTITLQEAECEYDDSTQRDDERRAGVDEQTPVDTFIKHNGDKYYV